MTRDLPYLAKRCKDALKRTAQAADIAGIRALLAHVKDEPPGNGLFYPAIKTTSNLPGPGLKVEITVIAAA